MKLTKKFSLFEKYRKLIILDAYLKGYQTKIFIIILLELTASAFNLINPVFLQIFTDRIILNGEADLLAFVCTGPILLYGIQTSVLYCAKIIRTNAVSAILVSIRKSILYNMVKLPQKEYETYKKGDLEHIINSDFLLLDKFFNRQVIDYIVSIIYLIIVIAAMIRINGVLFLISCAIIPLPYIILRVIGLINYKRVKSRRILYGQYEDFVYESLSFWKEIKNLNLQRYMLKKFLEYRHKIARYDNQSGYLTYIGEMGAFISEALATRIILYLAGGIFAMKQMITIGNLLVFITYFENFYKQITVINQCGYEFYSDLPSLDKICGLLKVHIAGNKSETSLIRKWTGDIQFDQVSFRYQEGLEDILKQVTFTVKQGEKVAVVGKNGSGKTTLAKLLSGIYKPSKGKILVDSVDLSQCTKEEIQQNTGVLLQNFSLYDGSILENIRLFYPGIENKEAEKVLKEVQLEAWIKSLPNGFHTRIGENGRNLSGGQRQRLAFARTLLKEPSVYILDEASSALDVAAEYNFFQLINQYCDGKTVFFITHRKNFLTMADKILVLDEGNIIGFGRHEELISSNLVYRELFMD